MKGIPTESHGSGRIAVLVATSHSGTSLVSCDNRERARVPCIKASNRYGRSFTAPHRQLFLVIQAIGHAAQSLHRLPYPCLAGHGNRRRPASRREHPPLRSRSGRRVH